jgi:hypothetical protein
MSKGTLSLLAGAALLLLTFVVKDARGGNFVILKEGTPVVVALKGDFDAASLKEGAKVPMAVAEKVMNEGYVLIDAGAPVEAAFTPGKSEVKGAGLLEIASVEAADGQDVMLRAAPEATETAESKDAAAPFSISVQEGNLRLPKGTSFRVYLSDSYFIEE